jgi:hypothetical protein
MGNESHRYKNTFSVVKNAVGPLLALMDALIAQISEVDRQDPEARRIKVYPETLALEQIHGVLTLTAPTFVLTLEDKNRFRRAEMRDVFWVSVCGVANRVAAIHSSESPRPVTDTCELYSSGAGAGRTAPKPEPEMVDGAPQPLRWLTRANR